MDPPTSLRWAPLDTPKRIHSLQPANGLRPTVLATTRAAVSMAEAFVANGQPEGMHLNAEEIYIFLRAVLARDLGADAEWRQAPPLLRNAVMIILKWCERESDAFAIRIPRIKRLCGTKIADFLHLSFLRTKNDTHSFQVIGALPEDAYLFKCALQATLGSSTSQNKTPKLDEKGREIEGSFMQFTQRWRIYAKADALCFKVLSRVLSDAQLLMVPKLIHGGAFANTASRFYPSYVQVFYAIANEHNLPLRKHGTTSMLHWLGLELTHTKLRDCVNPQVFARLLTRLCGNDVVEIFTLRKSGLAEGLKAYLAELDWLRFFRQSAKPHLAYLIDALARTEKHGELAGSLSHVFNELARGSDRVALPGTLLSLRQLLEILEDQSIEPTLLRGLFFALETSEPGQHASKEPRIRVMPRDYPRPEALSETLAWKLHADKEFSALHAKFGQIWKEFETLLKICFYAEQTHSNKPPSEKPLLEARHILCSNQVHHAIPMALGAPHRSLCIPGPSSLEHEPKLPLFAYKYPISSVAPIVDIRLAGHESAPWICAETDYRLFG